MAGSNYVKCVRGTQSAFGSLVLKDNNTLYFISGDTTNPSSAIYLGSELVADDGANNLSELRDVLISSLSNKDILVFNNTTHKWENISFENLVLDIQKSLNFDENIFELTETGTLTLAGFEGAKDNSVFAKVGGKGVWLDVSNHLKRTIVDSVMDIDEDALDADQYIYMVKASSDEAGEDDIYDEYMVIDGVLEKIGSWTVDLSDYATVEAMEELEDEIADLKDAMTWQDFSF